MPVNEDVSIRLLFPEDAADYRKIRLTALATAPEAFGTTHQEESARPMSSFVDRVQTTAIFGAYMNGTIVGMAGFVRCAGQKEKHKGFLAGMFVDPSVQGRGIGKALVTAVIEHASSVVEQVTLTVVTTNEPAIALYEALGFESYGIEPHSLKTDHGYADELLMVRYCIAGDS